MANKPESPDYFEKYPLGIRSELMLRNQFEVRMNFPNDVWKDYYAEYRRIEDLIVDNNIKGQELEKNGEIEKAIEIYERNADIVATTPHPYDRLRIIYTRQKKFRKAIEACNKAVRTYKMLDQVSDHDFSDSIGKYKEWARKLEKKL